MRLDPVPGPAQHWLPGLPVSQGQDSYWRTGLISGLSYSHGRGRERYSFLKVGCLRSKETQYSQHENDMTEEQVEDGNSHMATLQTATPERVGPESAMGPQRRLLSDGSHNKGITHARTHT